MYLEIKKKTKKKKIITMSKTDLYQFCIKLVKLILEIERMED